MLSFVTYWQLPPEDENEFLDFLQSTGTILSLPAHWAETKEELVPQPIATFIERHDPDQVLFGIEEHVLHEAPEVREFNGNIRFGIPVMKSRIITYRRGKIREGKLAQSNISAYLDYPAEDASRLILKSTDFVGWVKKVIDWTKKATSERIERNGHGYRATARAKTAVCEGKLEAVLY